MSHDDSILPSLDENVLSFGFQHTLPNIIKVIGVGGAGCNSVNRMSQLGIQNVDFVVCNTDVHVLCSSPVPIKIQLGASLTGGRGVGNSPELGEQSAIESIDLVRQVLDNCTRMVFITAGMGGGTGTGAAPVIASLAKEMGILTIAVVTIPSPVEGKKRFNQALDGVVKLKKAVDSVLVIPNEKLQQEYENLPASEAFAKADEVIATVVKSIAEIITIHGPINSDFADLYTVLSQSSCFIIGKGLAEGKGRAMIALKRAMEYPLFENENLNDARNILVEITSGNEEVRMGEIGMILDSLQKSIGLNADIIWGDSIDLNLGNQICITILATGFKEDNVSSFIQKETVKFEKSDLKDQYSFDYNVEEGKPISKNRKEVEFEVSHSDSGLDLLLKNHKLKQSEESNETHNGNWFLKQFNTIFEEKETDIDK